MSEEKKSDFFSLEVPAAQSKKSARPTSPTDSSHSSRSTSPAGATRSQLPAGQLSVELQCKVSAQMARLSVLQDMQERLPRIATLEHLLEFRGNVEDTFKMFLREHSYFETVWPAACLGHEYFKDNIFLQAHRAAGLSQNYPTFEQLHAFVAARARAQERLESETPSPITSAQTKKTAQPSAAPKSTGTVSRTATFASGSTAHPCDKCDGNHFIVACDQFRGLTPAARREVVERKRLCFNCLGRHSAKSCRSSQKCKTCSGRHHTMLHVQPSSSHQGSSKQGGSDKAQPSSSAH